MHEKEVLQLRDLIAKLTEKVEELNKKVNKNTQWVDDMYQKQLRPRRM